MNGYLRQAAFGTVAIAALYIAACALGFALLVAAFNIGILAQFDILFYRGLILVGLAFLVTFGLLAGALARWRPQNLGARDAFAAAVLSLSLNICFLVVVPVTVDRSISIFLLARMAEHPDETFSRDEMTALFTRAYVRDGRQIDRRLYEQALSGNVKKVGEAYRISARGRLVIETAKIVARLFDSHAGIVEPRPIETAATPPRTGQ